MKWSRKTDDGWWLELDHWLHEFRFYSFSCWLPFGFFALLYFSVRIHFFASFLSCQFLLFSLDSTRHRHFVSLPPLLSFFFVFRCFFDEFRIFNVFQLIIPLRNDKLCATWQRWNWDKKNTVIHTVKKSQEIQDKMSNGKSRKEQWEKMRRPNRTFWLVKHFFLSVLVWFQLSDKKKKLRRRMKERTGTLLLATKQRSI